MPESICCVVHENIYLSLLCISILYISFIAVSLYFFSQSLSWTDLAAYLLLFILLCLSGGRLLLLNAGLSKDVYYEVQSYAEILIDEKPDLLSTFPFVQKIEDPGNDLNKINAQTVPVNLYCDKTISETQCTQIEKFIMDRISAMGGRPYADLHLSLFAPAPDNPAENRKFFSKTISVNAQKEVRDITRWVEKAFPPHPRLGMAALIMLAYLLCFNLFCAFCPGTASRTAPPCFILSFTVIILLFFGGFYLLNNFHHAILYRHLLMLLVAPYALLELGYWYIRCFFQTKLPPRAIILLTQCFALFSMLSGGLLLIVDYGLD